MLQLWIPVVVVLQIIIYLNHVHYHLYYEKKGNEDRLKIRTYFIHKLLGLTITFNVLDFEPDKDESNIIDIAKYFSNELGGDKESKNTNAFLEIAPSLIKYQVFFKVISGILSREPSKVPPLRIGSLFKNMVIGTMLRISPLCRKFALDIEIGLDDAANTAIATGIIHGFVGNSMAFITRFSNFNKGYPEINIVPVYNKNVFNISLNSIFKVRLGHIILASIRTVINLIKSYVCGGV